MHIETLRKQAKMNELTIETIRAAVANDMGAVTVVIAAFEPHIGRLAAKYATSGGRYDADRAEELAQAGRIALWERIREFNGDSVGEFVSYMDKWLRGTMAGERREDAQSGVSRQTAWRFSKCLDVTGGDPYAAEREAVRPDGCLGTERMTPETAYAARLAWMGVAYLDAPEGSEHGATLGDRIADTYGVPDDLLEASDIDAARRRAVRTAVHATLDRMGRQAAFALRATYGIAPVPHMESDAEIGAALGIDPKRIRRIRSMGKDRFRELYLAGAADAVAVAA